MRYEVYCFLNLKLLKGKTDLFSIAFTFVSIILIKVKLCLHLLTKTLVSWYPHLKLLLYLDDLRKIRDGRGKRNI